MFNSPTLFKVNLIDIMVKSVAIGSPSSRALAGDLSSPLIKETLDSGHNSGLPNQALREQAATDYHYYKPAAECIDTSEEPEYEYLDGASSYTV